MNDHGHSVIQRSKFQSGRMLSIRPRLHMHWEMLMEEMLGPTTVTVRVRVDVCDLEVSAVLQRPPESP